MIQAHLFLLLLISTGSYSQNIAMTLPLWTMTLPLEVNGTAGVDVVLPCSFTHPLQHNYSNNITVKWITTQFHNKPLFQCTVNNFTNLAPDCSLSDQSLRFSLNGDPKKGNLSLLIRQLVETDGGLYFCRVELSEKHSKWQDVNGTRLNVLEKAQIISLSWVTPPFGQGNGTLVCVVKGNPQPSITWWSSKGPIITGVTTRQPNSSHWTSSIPYFSQDVYTCRATNSLGMVETQFPSGSTNLTVVLSLCVVMVLLLLLGVAVFCLWKKGYLRCNSKNSQQPSVLCITNQTPAVVGESSIYANGPEMGSGSGNHCESQQSLYQNNSPQDVKMELVYSTIEMNTSTQRPLGASPVPMPDEGVLYSLINCG
ncbi:hypothetical protein DPEC_G00141210 [Dallia pectoralis]|uniref:Uncharacterized protein n=1 Tax=Dallia pectoralis TaxID=75939 RepID=A0ACC2GMY8_DALPE|nr:hypothetical protein DPEC_G00141210 [Dallia pectoralis]